MIDKAVRFAAKVHEGVTRKGTNQPYIFHPLEVLSLVSMMSLDDEVMCAAVLHDTVEDSNVTLDDLKKQFSPRVMQLVAYETEDKRGQVNKAGTWVERKQETIDLIRNIDDIEGKMICLADKVSNLRSFHLGLLEKGENFWKLFNMNDPLKHYWYYSELRDALKQLENYSVYKEYCFLIDAVFAEYLKGEKE